jgi:predicted ATPase with chaperone activity
MLARRLTTILPEVTLAEAIDTTRIHHVAGCTGDRTAVVTTLLFCVPHQINSDVDLTGAQMHDSRRSLVRWCSMATRCRVGGEACREASYQKGCRG